MVRVPFLRSALVACVLWGTATEARAATSPGSVTAGSYHSCALDGAQRAWCWGYGLDGQLGGGSTTSSQLLPGLVTNLDGPIEGVTSGGYHGCAIGADGALYCWGSNECGELGDGTTTDRSTPTRVTLAGPAASVASGLCHTCARLRDGTLWCWGGNEDGELGDGTTDDSLTPIQVEALGSEVTDVAAGAYHTCAVQADETLRCWGWNGRGQLGDGTTTDRHAPTLVGLAGVASVAAGVLHTCAVGVDGTLHCFGDNQNGQLGDGTKVERHLPVQVTALGDGVDRAALGYEHSCALMLDRTAQCWGLNAYGQLGDGSFTSRSLPAAITGLGSDVTELASGWYHACARKVDGSLSCWGWNGVGALGDGTTTTRATPTPLAPLPTPQAPAVPANSRWSTPLLAFLLAGVALAAGRRRPRDANPRAGASLRHESSALARHPPARVTTDLRLPRG